MKALIFLYRLLRTWICRPLCNIKLLKERQVAVVELASDVIQLAAVRKVLGTLPDFERQIAK